MFIISFIAYNYNSILQAGLQHDRLLIVKESEAAFIFCQQLPIEKLSGAEDGFTMSKMGTKYVIVDLGGMSFVPVNTIAKNNFIN